MRKKVVFDRTKMECPEEFFEQLGIEEDEVLNIKVILSKEVSVAFSVRELEDTSIIIAMPEKGKFEAIRIHGRAAPEDMVYWNDKEKKVILADICNEMFGIETGKYFDWHQEYRQCHA